MEIVALRLWECHHMLARQTLQNFFIHQYATDHDLSPRTISEYKLQVGKLEKWWRSQHNREFLLVDLSRQVIRDYMSYERRTVQNAAPTVNKSRRTLLAIWKYAYEEELVEERPDRIKRLKEETHDPVAWTLDEMGLILQKASELSGRIPRSSVPKSVFWKALIWSVYNTGGRITAVMSITWDDVDLDNMSMRIRARSQKQKSDQTYALKLETMAALRKLDEYQRPDETVFGCWPFDRTQDPWRSLNYHLRKILTAANLPTGSKDMFHKFRKTTATQINRVRGIAAAQHTLGHSSSSVTRRYLDPKQDVHHKTSDMLESPQRPPRDV